MKKQCTPYEQAKKDIKKDKKMWDPRVALGDAIQKKQSKDKKERAKMDREKECNARINR